MRIDWTDLPAAKIAAPYMDILTDLTGHTSHFKNREEAYQAYLALPEDIRRAMGYMLCLLQADACASKDRLPLYDKDLCMPVSFLDRMTYDEPEIRYKIDRRGCFHPGSRFFYTDEFIQDDQNEAADLAECFVEDPCGATDVRVQQLGELRGIQFHQQRPLWCVTFRLLDSAWKDADSMILNVSTFAEVVCTFGELVGGDPENAFVLSREICTPQTPEY